MTVTACAVDETCEARGIDEIQNPYWDAVKDRVSTTGYLAQLYGVAMVTNAPDADDVSIEVLLSQARILEERDRLCREYSFTIPDPVSLKFVLSYCRDGVLDPMAGTGYWAWLLSQLGVNVLAYDERPPDRLDNFYHERNQVHFPVRKGHAPWVAKHRGKGRTLLLSWPPPHCRDGELTVASFTGDRVIYIGEGGSCGTPAMFDRLESHWRQVASHNPVLWEGMRDFIAVYDRLPSWSITREGDSRKAELLSTLKVLLEDESLSDEERDRAKFLLNVLADED